MKIPQKSRRASGIAYVKRQFGEISPGTQTVSKFFNASESRTKSPVWWNEIPIIKLIKDNDIHIICQKENGVDFFYLRIPVNDIEGHIKEGRLDIRVKKNKEEVVVLHLSARSDNLFQDLRGKGKINFGKYLQEPGTRNQEQGQFISKIQSVNKIRCSMNSEDGD